MRILGLMLLLLGCWGVILGAFERLSKGLMATGHHHGFSKESIQGRSPRVYQGYRWVGKVLTDTTVPLVYARDPSLN